METQIRKEQAQTQESGISTGNTGTGVQLGVPEFVKRADEIRQGLELENARMERNIAELKQLKQWDTLGGTTNSAAPVKKEETPAEYARRVTGQRL